MSNEPDHDGSFSVPNPEITGREKMIKKLEHNLFNSKELIFQSKICFYLKIDNRIEIIKGGEVSCITFRVVGNFVAVTGKNNNIHGTKTVINTEQISFL